MVLGAFREDNEQDVLHASDRNVSVFFVTMELVEHLNPCFICENQASILEVDAMLASIDFILSVIPFDETAIHFF